MTTAQIYYVTNRRHRGRDRWRPTGYGTAASKDGAENLRFGMVSIPVEEDRVLQFLSMESGFGAGNGRELASYLVKRRRQATIDAFPENLSKHQHEAMQVDAQLGSRRAFDELSRIMANRKDVLIFVHGFNVGWWESVGSALSLQLMLNRDPDRGASTSRAKEIQVILFTWPSDGKAIPYWSYYSDRSDAEISGYAAGRGVLKLRDFLIESRRRAMDNDEEPCRNSIHLLCHSMGNYVLQNALRRISECSVGARPPRIFDQVFLCSADVADDVLEPEAPMYRLPQMARNVTIYHNRGDLSMPVSDYTKGNSDRLGSAGANRPSDLDARVHQVDCSDIVTGFIEHSYYHCGDVCNDIRQSIDGIAPDDVTRARQAVQHGWPNVWRLPGSTGQPR